MPAETVFRTSAIIVLLVALGGLFTLGGTDWPVGPTAHPSADELVEDPAAHVGEELQITGEVIDAEAVQIEVEGEYGTIILDVEGIPADAVTDGHDLSITGELTDELVIEADSQRFATRAPWETTYMYLISAIGVLLVGAVGLNFWRPSLEHLALVPREIPLHRRITNRSGGHRA